MVSEQLPSLTARYYGDMVTNFSHHDIITKGQHLQKDTLL